MPHSTPHLRSYASPQFTLCVSEPFRIRYNAGMSKPTPEPPVKLTVKVSHQDYMRLEAVKARRRRSTQDLVYEWLRAGLTVAEREDQPSG